METEIWKPIPGYEGLYEVSSFGRVKSLDRIITRKKVDTFIKGDLKCMSVNNSGYYKVSLYKENKYRNFYVHKLVFCAFNNIGLMVRIMINHLDEDKLNNKISNLELTNSRENATYSINKKITSSIYTGVYLKKTTKSGKTYFYWRSCIRIDNKNIELGTFKTEKEAHKAYLEALKEHGLENKYATENQE
jgi:hypothetical protein